MPKPVPVPDAKVVPGTSSDTSQHKNTCKYESNINISGNPTAVKNFNSLKNYFNQNIMKVISIFQLILPKMYQFTF